MVSLNIKLINLWKKQTVLLLDIYNDLFEKGNYTIYSCSNSKIIFSNGIFYLIFNYGTDQYSYSKLMVLEGMKIQYLDTVLTLEDFLKANKISISVTDYHATNLKKYIPRIKGYQLLIEKYLIDILTSKEPPSDSLFL
ncbi:MAG: hypothetical protein ACJATI_001166 [Halioglobus sp.]|jgi:hypothetical protein